MACRSSTIPTTFLRDTRSIPCNKNNIVKLRLLKQILWEAELPRGHTLVAFDVSDYLLWVATNSNQGSFDGEPGLPVTTTQIYAISPGE